MVWNTCLRFALFLELFLKWFHMLMYNVLSKFELLRQRIFNVFEKCIYVFHIVILRSNMYVLIFFLRILRIFQWGHQHSIISLTFFSEIRFQNPFEVPIKSRSLFPLLLFALFFFAKRLPLPFFLLFVFGIHISFWYPVLWNDSLPIPFKNT